MTLRIVSGSIKGRKLKGPKGKNIRPASARVRKSIFAILGDLQGQTVLDLFAGTGSMGLQALSHGASSVSFVDHNQHAIHLLLTNLETTGLLNLAHVIKKTAHQAIYYLHKKKKYYDLIFLDPPYDQGLVDKSLIQLNRYPLLQEEGLLLCEHSIRERPTFLSGLEPLDERKYGQTLISIFKKI